jgi:hypothetical protein
LWLNYLAFLPIPAVMIGLYAVQRPRIPRLGLVGAFLYGAAFVYFAHTTLLALALRVPTYERLWDQLGVTYTAHGVLMVVGGGAFGLATIRAGIVPSWTAWLFLSGIGLNLIVASLSLPDLLQTIGSALRNLGLIAMGVVTLRAQTEASAADHLPGVST